MSECCDCHGDFAYHETGDGKRRRCCSCEEDHSQEILTEIYIAAGGFQGRDAAPSEQEALCQVKELADEARAAAEEAAREDKEKRDG